MKNEKRVYKRSFKNLVNLLVVLAFFLLGIVLSGFTACAVAGGARLSYYLLYCVQVIVDLISASALAFLVMSGFNRYSADEIIDTKAKKIIYALSSLVITVIFAMADCCCIWCFMYCFKYCC